MPREWLYVRLADIYHRPEWELRETPADELLRWVSLRGVQGKVDADWAGLGPDDELTRYGGDDEW